VTLFVEVQVLRESRASAMIGNRVWGFIRALWRNMISLPMKYF
jgi:hypothetical protein